MRMAPRCQHGIRRVTIAQPRAVKPEARRADEGRWLPRHSAGLQVRAEAMAIEVRPPMPRGASASPATRTSRLVERSCQKKLSRVTGTVTGSCFLPAPSRAGAPGTLPPSTVHDRTIFSRGDQAPVRPRSPPAASGNEVPGRDRRHPALRLYTFINARRMRPVESPGLGHSERMRREIWPATGNRHTSPG